MNKNHSIDSCSSTAERFGRKGFVELDTIISVFAFIGGVLLIVLVFLFPGPPVLDEGPLYETAAVFLGVLGVFQILARFGFSHQEDWNQVLKISGFLILVLELGVFLFWASRSYEPDPSPPSPDIDIDEQVYPYKGDNTKTQIVLLPVSSTSSFSADEVRIFFKAALGGRNDPVEVVSGRISDLSSPSVDVDCENAPTATEVSVANIPGGFKVGEEWTLVLEVEDSAFAADITYMEGTQIPENEKIFGVSSIPPIEIG